MKSPSIIWDQYCYNEQTNLVLLAVKGSRGHPYVLVGIATEQRAGRQRNRISLCGWNKGLKSIQNSSDTDQKDLKPNPPH